MPLKQPTIKKSAKAVLPEKKTRGKAAQGAPAAPRNTPTSITLDPDFLTEFALILGNASDKPESQMTSLEKMEMVDRGLTKNHLTQLKKITKLDYDDLARALSVTRATLITKKGDEKFAPVVTEKIVGLADLYSYGYTVFEDQERFNQWMFRPNRALGGRPPYDLIHNQFGREEVRSLIGRIEYGVYS